LLGLHHCLVGRDRLQAALMQWFRVLPVLFLRRGLSRELKR
jgi:hypothetical protein